MPRQFHTSSLLFNRAFHFCHRALAPDSCSLVWRITFENALKSLFELRESESVQKNFMASPAKLTAQLCFHAQLNEPLRKLIDIIVFDQKTVDSIFDHFGSAAALSSDDRFAVLHRFDINEPETFLRARHDEH